MFEKYSDIVTVEIIMEMLCIGKNAAYHLLRTNQIRHAKIGRKYIIPKTAVVNFINSLCYNDSQIIDGELQKVIEGDIA